ncbi:MAG: type IV pilus assembly protein PilM [Planctomycetota bacterium]|nr:type IV pilus assembly protein PilM [Planctomycetota bacterium]
MAKVQAVWGIDIGQCSLKALRCVPGDNGEVIADAFDFVEYPKILSQPDVDPEELVSEALQQFLSRNNVKGDKVAVSVTGQAGLSRFFKPPPVDPKTLPDIVKYEAKQQIPFPLEDVIWDYQQIGGTEVDGLIVDAEVGLFAMKREAVYRALQPFTDAGIEVDYIQLSPLAGFNFVINDILSDVSPDMEIDPENPPESLVLLALGTETTDLVITNGVNLWIRNIPIGGNHFTKQLSRELKLTFTKAEHLKRNTRQAADPKTLFQAMRPVFNDLVTEIQRSITYFRGNNRNAKIGRMVMVGNAAKLPGLRQYLIKNLATEIVKFDKYPMLEGDVVVNQKTFTENILTFNVAYGLCLQGLEESRIEINLLPQEFLTERLIRAKKPWALASLGAVMVGLTCSLLFTANGWWKVNENRLVDGKSWKDSFSEVDRVSKTSKSYIDQDGELTKQQGQFAALNTELTQSKEPFRLASEIYSAVLQAFPEGEKTKKGEPFNPLTMDYADRETIIIEDWEWIDYDKKGMQAWYTSYSGDPKFGVPNEFEETRSGVVDPNQPQNEIEEKAEGGNKAKKKGADKKKQEDKRPENAGRVLVMNCYHDHNDLVKYPDASQRERGYVKNRLIQKLLYGKFKFKTKDFDAQAGVNLEENTITVESHLFTQDTALIYRVSAGGTAIGGLENGSLYYVREVSGDTFKLSTTREADDGKGNVVDLTTAGTGNHSFNEELTYDLLGVKYPVFIGSISEEIEIPNPYYARFFETGDIPDKDPADWTAEEKRKYSESWFVKRFKFRLEIAWEPTLFTDRQIRYQEKEAAAKKAMPKGQQPAPKNDGNQNDPKQPAKKQPAKKQPAKKQPAPKNDGDQNDPKQPAKKQPAKKQPAEKGSQPGKN